MDQLNQNNQNTITHQSQEQVFQQIIQIQTQQGEHHEINQKKKAIISIKEITFINNENKIDIQNQTTVQKADIDKQLDQNADQSPTKVITQQCYYCGISQDSDFIFLQCGHEFHADCLKSMLEKQVKQQTSMFKCECKMKIPQTYVKKYLSPFDLQIYFQVQAQSLPKLSKEKKWKKCPHQVCDYIYIEMPLESKDSVICPNCLENILGKSMINQTLKSQNI